MRVSFNNGDFLDIDRNDISSVEAVLEAALYFGDGDLVKAHKYVSLQEGWAISVIYKSDEGSVFRDNVSKNTALKKIYGEVLERVEYTNVFPYDKLLSVKAPGPMKKPVTLYFDSSPVVVPYVEGKEYAEIVADAAVDKCDGIGEAIEYMARLSNDNVLVMTKGQDIDDEPCARVETHDAIRVLSRRIRLRPHLVTTPSPMHKPDGFYVESPIATKCNAIRDMLLKKNADYGNSALDPVRIFSKADAEEQIKVRIDDKLSRLAGAGEKNFTEDTVMDLVGYLILLMVKMEEG